MKHIHFDIIDSTNKYLKENYKTLEHLTIVTANYQTHGRGQFDRIWDSNQGENLICSILLKEKSSFDSIKTKLNIVKYIKSILQTYNIQSSFKIPNDIYVNERKIAGILIESEVIQDDIQYVVIGIGLNVNQRMFGNYPATSIASETTKEIDLVQFTNKFIQGLYKLV